MSTLRFDNTIATRMMKEALEFCAEKVGLIDGEQARNVIRTGDCCVCEYLRYALVKEVAEYLGSVDDTIQAIYTYEPDHAVFADEFVPARPNLSPGFNMIARVSRKSAALSSVVASMRSALAEEYGRLGCLKANALCPELDVKVADEHDIQNRNGYGALLDSLYVRPIEVWHR